MQNIDNKKYLSETIGVLRFPLMVCIVFLHIYIPYKSDHLFVSFYDKYIVESIARLAVPLFFFISGFLFFNKVDCYDFLEYKSKLKTRFMRLFVPYILWGLFVVGIRYVCYLFGQSDNINLFVEGSRWLYHVILFPINYQLWFVRDLFIVALLSPIVYYLLKRLNYFFVVGLGIVWLCYHNNFFVLFDLEDFVSSKTILKPAGYDFVSLFFFSFGAWFAIFNRDFTLLFKSCFPIAIVPYLFFAIYRFIVDDIFLSEFCHRLAILSGMVFFVVIVYLLLKSGKVKRNLFLENGGQMIYYYHTIFLTYFVGVLKMLHVFEIDNSFVYSLVYFSVPVVTILLGLGLYKVGEKRCPKVMNFVLGLK